MAIRESRTWTLALVVLVSLAVAWQPWPRARRLADARVAHLAGALVLLVLLFGAYVWSKTAQNG